MGLIAFSGPLLGAAAFGAFWLADVKGAESIEPVFPAFLLLILFGGAILLGAINTGRRRAILTVAGGRLTVRQTGMLGGKRGEWSRDEIEDIRSGPCGLSVGQKNMQTAYELQIHPRGGRNFGLLAGRDPVELAWMAAELRGAIRLTSA